jgi:polysaccharide biosynthesis/export protein
VRRFLAIAALAAVAAVGCAGLNPPVACGVVRSAYEPVPVYRVGCPDVLAVRFVDRPQLDCLVAVDLDGRLPVSDSIHPHVEGETLADTRQSLAAATGCDPTRVVVELADARTGRLYLFGPELSRQRIVPFIGNERLLDLLHRTGCLRDVSADLGDVFVLRPNVAAGQPPVVFRTDLRAVQSGDHSTNVLLEPGDQIHVGENRRSSFARLLPDWLKPGFCRMFGGGPTVAR